jgi:hypothetical protein
MSKPAEIIVGASGAVVSRASHGYLQRSDIITKQSGRSFSRDT